MVTPNPLAFSALPSRDDIELQRVLDRNRAQTRQSYQDAGQFAQSRQKIDARTGEILSAPPTAPPTTRQYAQGSNRWEGMHPNDGGGYASTYRGQAPMDGVGGPEMLIAQSVSPAEAARAEIARRRAENAVPAGATPAAAPATPAEAARAELDRRKGRAPAAPVGASGSPALYINNLKTEEQIRAEPAMSQGGSRMVDPNAVADFMRNPAPAYDAGADIMANAEPMKADRGYTFASNMLNSLTLGNAANVAAVPRMLRTGQDFDESRGQIREEMAQGRQDNPVTAFAGDAAGFVAPGGLVAKAGGRLLQPLTAAAQRLSPTVGFLAKTAAAGTLGAADAALYGGTVQAENDAAARGEEASLGERLDTAGDIAKFGAAFGGAMPAAGVAFRPVARAAEGAVASVADVFKPGSRQAFDKKVADDAVRRSLERSGIVTAEDLAARAAKYGDKPVVTGELGQDALNSLVALVRSKGTTAEKAVAVLEDRVSGLPGRMMRDLAAETGLPPEAILGQIDEMVKAGQKTASPLYAAAEAERFDATPRLAQILEESPTGQRALAIAVSRMKDDAAAKGVPLGSQAPLRLYDEAKKVLDEMVEKAIEKKESPWPFEQVRAALVKELDQIVPGQYAAAREAGGDAPRIKEAFGQGKRALSGRFVTDEIVRQVSELTGQPLTAYQSGVVQNMVSAVERGAMSPRMINSPGFQQKLKAVFGNDAGGALIDRLKLEAELSQKGARWNPNVGSVTSQAMLGEPSKMGDELLRAGANAATGNKVGLVVQAINLLRRQGYSEGQLNEIGNLLLSSPDDALKRLFPGYRPQGPSGAPGAAAAGNSSPSPTPAPMANALTSGAPDNAFAGLPTNALTTPPNQNSFALPAVTSIGGGTYGYNNAFDMDGDGEISERERLLSGVGGTVLGGAGGAVLGNMLTRGRNVAPGASQQTFGGINAKTADKAKLARAQEMDAADADRRAIWDATGWFKGVDGKWRFEIDDSGAQVRNPAFFFEADGPQRLQDQLDHPSLKSAYPDVNPSLEPSAPGEGSFYPDRDAMSVPSVLPKKAYSGKKHLKHYVDGQRSVTLHETQHAIQSNESFARGGNTGQHYPEALIEKLDELRNTQETLVRESWSAKTPDEKAHYLKLRSDVEADIEKTRRQIREEKFDRYRRLAGEVEARNVQTRRDFTPDQRRAQAPWETQDVPDDQQIVRFGSGGPQMSMGNGLTRPPAPANDRRLVDRMFSPKPGSPPDNVLPNVQGAPRAANDADVVPLGPSRAPDMFNDLTLEERMMLERRLGKPQPRKATAGPDGTIAPPDPVIGEYQTPDGPVRLTAKTWVDERGELVMSPDWPTNAFSDLAGALDQRGKEIRRPNQDFGRLRTDSVWAQQNPEAARQMSQDVAQRFVNQAQSGGRPVSILAQLDEFDNEALVRMVQDAAPSTHVVLRRKDGDGIALVEKEWLRQNRDARFPDATWSRFGVGRQYVRYSDRAPDRGGADNLPPIDQASMFSFGGRSGGPQMSVNAPMRNALTTPPKPPGSYRMSDRLVDGAIGGAVGTVAGAPGAEANTAEDAALQEARARVLQIEQEAIPQIEADLRTFREGQPEDIQRLLIRLGYDLGTTGPNRDGVDGNIGPQTRPAIQAETAKLEAQMQTAREELQAARERMEEQEVAAAYREADPGGLHKLIREKGPLVGFAAGALGGKVLRGSAVRGTAKKDAARVAKIDALLTPGPVSPGGPNAPKGVNQRATRLNDFWRQGGAGDNLPFQENAKGDMVRKPKAATVSSLYPPEASRYRAPDFVWPAFWMAEAGGAQAGLSYAEGELAKAEQEASENPTVANLKKVEGWKDAVGWLTASRNIGVGVAASRLAMPLVSKYKPARPNVQEAEAERAAVLKAIDAQRAAAKTVKK